MTNKNLQTHRAVIVVDVQNDFCNDGALAVADADSILPLVNQTIRQAEQQGDLILLSRDWHPANHASFQENGGRWPTHCVAGTWGAKFHAQLYQPASARLVNKALEPEVEVYSALQGVLQHDASQSVAEYLRQNAVEQVLVMGLALDYCVKHTCLDLVQAGFEVSILGAATRAIDAAHVRVLRAELQLAGVNWLD